MKCRRRSVQALQTQQRGPGGIAGKQRTVARRLRRGDGEGRYGQVQGYRCHVCSQGLQRGFCVHVAAQMLSWCNSMREEEQ